MRNAIRGGGMRLALISIGILALIFGQPSIGTAAGQAEPKVNVLIGFTHQPGPAEQALVGRAGGTIKYTYQLIPGIAASVRESAVDGLRKNPNVTYIEADGQVRAAVVTTVPKGPKKDTKGTLDWGVSRIDAEHVWGGAEAATNVTAGSNAGAGVDVAIIDTGIDLDHPDLASNIKGNVNLCFYYDTNNSTKVACAPDGDDDNGHGSHVAGIVAAVENQEGVIGVAPQANLYAVKVLDRYGRGWISDIVAGVEWSAGLNGGKKVDVINMSLVVKSDYQSLRDAVTVAYNSGVLIVAAAGNAGTCSGGEDTVKYPGRYNVVIAVAATNKVDERPCFSSTGSAIEVAGPGDDIYSTDKNAGYIPNSGTSMASPHVAGTAALVWAAYPSWSHEQVRAQLQATAEDIGLPGTWMGHGLVDAQYAAAGSAPAATGSLSGVVTKASDGTAIGSTTVSTDTGQSGTTAADGSYTIAGVPTGDRQVTASATDFDSQTKTATVNENKTTWVDFSLTASDGGGGGPPPCKGKNKNDPGCP